MPAEFAIALIFFVSAFTFSFAGFGVSLVAVPLLALLLPTKTAVIFQFPYAICVVAYHAWRFRGQMMWSLFWPLVIGAAAMMPIGMLALSRLPDFYLKPALGSFLVLAVIANRTSWGKRAAQRFKASKGWGVFWGALSGIFQGAYTTGGPPAVIFVRATVAEPAAAKGVLGTYFTFLYSSMAVLYGVGGLFSWQLFFKALWYGPLVILGIVLGAWAFRKVSNAGYLLVVDVLLLLAALMLWLRP